MRLDSDEGKRIRKTLRAAREATAAAPNPQTRKMVADATKLTQGVPGAKPGELAKITEPMAQLRPIIDRMAPAVSPVARNALANWRAESERRQAEMAETMKRIERAEREKAQRERRADEAVIAMADDLARANEREKRMFRVAVVSTILTAIATAAAILPHLLS